MNAPNVPVTAVLLGEVVAWDMNPKNLAGGLVTYHDMQQALRDAGLDPDAAKEMKPRAAFSRACKDLKKDRSIDKLKQAKGSSSCSFQFTKKLVQDSKIDFDYECQVHLDTDSGAITCPEQPALEAEATALFAHARQMRNAQDVTRLVQKLFTDNASLFPLVPNKGVAYFVPEVHREFTAKVDDFLQKLGGKLCRMPVPTGTAEGNASVRDAVQAGLSTVVDELNAAVDGWDDTTRHSTMEKAIKRWEAVEFKVDAYAEYLGSEQERVQKKLAEAKERLKAKILELKPDDLEDENEASEKPAEELAVA